MSRGKYLETPRLSGSCRKVVKNNKENPMKETTIQSVDPAEICECNPEWSSAPGSDEGDGCRCSVINPTEEDGVSEEK